MKFNYQARTKTGEIRTGVVEASDRTTAVDILKSHGLYVTAIEEKAVPIYARKLKVFERVSPKDIVYLSRQLAIMLKSNVPLVETLHTLADQTKNSDLREKILRISEEIEGGSPLSKSLAIFPKLFSPFYVNMVRSGEASGKLTEVFIYLADYLEQQNAFRSKVRGAMAYPALILVVFTIVVSIIVTWVIPQLATVLTQTGQELPWLTRIMMAVADLLKTKGWIVLIVLAGLIVLFYKWVKTSSGKKIVDETLIKIPLLSTFLKKLYLSRFALNLSTLISGGLPITKALEITGKVVGNSVYEKIIMKTRDEVKKGEKISSVLGRYPRYISPLFRQMILVGEKTGTLDTSLKNVVSFYQDDVDRGLDNFVKLLEPLFIIVLGGIVGLLMAAVIIPIYSIGGGI